MVWLIIHGWVLLLLAFLLGTLIGWWITAGQRKERVVVREASPEPSYEPSYVAAPVTAASQTDAADPPSPPDPGVRPMLFSSASEGPADDLKKISGIGPKYQDLLNEIGIYYYWQIQNWTPEEITWLDNRLEFPGRIKRDKWQQQAAVLAEGGNTEFASRYDKGETRSSYSAEETAEREQEKSNNKYLEDVRRYDADADEAVVQKIVKSLGIALQSKDASLVACSDEAERDQIAKGFCWRKLSMEYAEAEAAVREVCQEMQADRNKQRVTFYYLLARNAGKLDAL